jgi:hypothetical protein
MNISKKNCIGLISDKFPEFQLLWDSYQSEYTEIVGGLFGATPFKIEDRICGGMITFSDYVSKLLISNKTKPDQINEIFSFIEHLFTNGDEDVKNAIATCFLENILNKIPDKIDPKRFVPYLGPNSRDYCRAWDEFCGVQTEGL